MLTNGLKPRLSQIIPGRQSEANTASTEEDDMQDQHFFGVSPPIASTGKPRRSSAAHPKGGQGKSEHHFEANRSSQPSSPRRPFVQALQALERLVSTAGEPHAGVSSAISTSLSALAGRNAPQLLQSASSSPLTGFVGGDVVEERERTSDRERPQTAVDSGWEGAERLGEATPMASGGYRCRVGFGMMRLLTGPDGNDAEGTPVGVRPGEDVEAAVLGGGGSKVWAAAVLMLSQCPSAAPFAAAKMIGVMPISYRAISPDYAPWIHKCVHRVTVAAVGNQG